MKQRIEKIGISYPYEELVEEFEETISDARDLSNLPFLVEKIVWSIDHGTSGHEIQRLQELLNSVTHYLKYNVHFYPQLDDIVQGKSFRGQCGKFSSVFFREDVPRVYTRHMVTDEMRAMGMQAYDSMEKTDGLFFDHTPSHDVTYHMGSTKFPIDIFFLDLDAKNMYTITKIVSNVRPGTSKIFNQRHVAGVLETAGGFASSYDIEPGDAIKFDTPKYFSVYPKYEILTLPVHRLRDVRSSFDIESSTRLESLRDSDKVFVVDLSGVLGAEFQKRKILKECDLPRDRVVWVHENSF